MTTVGRGDGGAAWSLTDLPSLVEAVMDAVVTVEVRTEEGSGNGSGFVIPARSDRDQGVVITNAHVVLGAQEVVVVFADEETGETETRLCEPSADLAILALNRPPLGTLEPRLLSDIRVGEPVIAVGAPYAEKLGISVTLGIVSALNRARPTPDGGLVDMIQTDAAINDGNSGGPLIGLDGYVLGINSQGFVGDEGEVLPGIKFAVPVEFAERAYEEICETGDSFLRRGSVGVRLRRHRFPHVIRNSLRLAAGALVVEDPDPDSPAASAGLQKDDVIVSFDGSAVDDPGDVHRLLDRKTIGRVCHVAYVRDDTKHDTTVVPVEQKFG